MRVSLTFPLVVTVAALATPAVAQDGGTGPDLPVVCGADLTSEGRCIEETAVWCSAPNLQGESSTAGVLSHNCAEQGARCYEGAVGAWCLAYDGETCAYATNDGIAQFLCGDGSAGEGPGCDLVNGCSAFAPFCDPDDDSKCAGDDLILGCNGAGQALFIHCEGDCNGDPPACTDQPEGTACDQERLQCASDLECVGDDQQGFGRCLRPAPPAAIDAGNASWAPEAAGGCRCAAPGPATLPAGLVLMLGLGALLRRRRPVSLLRRRRPVSLLRRRRPVSLLRRRRPVS